MNANQEGCGDPGGGGRWSTLRQSLPSLAKTARDRGPLGIDWDNPTPNWDTLGWRRGRRRGR